MEIVDMGRSPTDKRIILGTEGQLVGKGHCPNCEAKLEYVVKPNKDTYSWCKWCGQRILWIGEDNHA